MRTLSTLVLLTTMTLSLAACSRGADPPPAEAPAAAATASAPAATATPTAATPADEATAPAWLEAAIDDPARAADKADDARRQMAAVMAFTGVQPGDVVVELSPGSGYWTRVFSQVVGPEGHVYTFWPTEMAKYSAESMAKWRQLAATPHYANVGILAQSAAELSVPAKADIVFTSQNYHDYHNLDTPIAEFDRRVFDLLKPGGAFIVIDHVAAAGSGTQATDSLHRIDPAAVKSELEAVGFEFAGASDALRNPADPHDIGVFDDSIRGHTDQFILRFRKPGGR